MGFGTSPAREPRANGGSLRLRRSTQSRVASPNENEALSLLDALGRWDLGYRVRSARCRRWCIRISDLGRPIIGSGSLRPFAALWTTGYLLHTVVMIPTAHHPHHLTHRGRNTTGEGTTRSGHHSDALDRCGRARCDRSQTVLCERPGLRRGDRVAHDKSVRDAPRSWRARGKTTIRLVRPLPCPRIGDLGHARRRDRHCPRWTGVVRLRIGAGPTGHPRCPTVWGTSVEQRRGSFGFIRFRVAPWSSQPLSHSSCSPVAPDVGAIAVLIAALAFAAGERFVAVCAAAIRRTAHARSLEPSGRPSSTGVS
jgi:hypothetical protein